MQVQAMYRAARHDIDPAIGHFQLAAAQVPFNRRGKRGDVAFQLVAQQFEGRRDRLESMH